MAMKPTSADAVAWAEADAQTVFLVLDTQFGERLLAMPATSPTWLVDSPLNTPVAQHLWQNTQSALPVEITTFKNLPTCDSLDFFESLLITIHEHHGPASQPHGYKTLIVIGLPFSAPVAEILANDGLQCYCLTTSGFVAKYP
jgi:hypothetical protein